MEKLSDIFVSAVLIVDSRTQGVDKKIKTLSKTLKLRYSNYEIVVINNGLRVGELKGAEGLLARTPCVRLVSLSKLHDIDTAIFAGIEASIGDYVCTLYNNDPIELLPEFVQKTQKQDIVFGVADNLQRRGKIEELGAKIFYWYSKRYLKIDVPNGSTYYICMSRSAANALTRSGRSLRHIRHMAKQVGYSTTNFSYKLPADSRLYTKAKATTLVSRAIDLISNYSSHPLRALSYFGIFAGFLNIIYAVYVVTINLSHDNVAKGWTTLSLQSSLMFFILFIILAVLAEYIGKILNEAQHEPPYHVMKELSSTVSIADETRRNVTK